MAMVVLDNVTTRDVGLAHERLSRNNPSIVVFRQHPNSTHRHILSDVEYDEVKDLTQFQITRLTAVEILRKEFLNQDANFLYPKLSQLLPPSLKLDPRQHEELVQQIIARAYGVLLDYSKYFPTVANLLMRVYLNIVTTHILSLEFEVEDHTFPPAAQSAIVALKEGRLNLSSTDTCTICLEDFPVGSSVTCMPCSHIFHWQCIVEWLNNSHYCLVRLFKVLT
nr:e3 ubiquitin-protein ligase ring1-like [Quercus suber]POF11392.1 e3 ubiquitin-protein ligase ring1-like [Quercus suber]